MPTAAAQTVNEWSELRRRMPTPLLLKFYKLADFSCILRILPSVCSEFRQIPHHGAKSVQYLCSLAPIVPTLTCDPLKSIVSASSSTQRLPSILPPYSSYTPSAASILLTVPWSSRTSLFSSELIYPAGRPFLHLVRFPSLFRTG